MTEKDNFVQEASEKYGSKRKKDAKKLVEKVGDLFACSELNEDDKDQVFRAITETYWRAKDNNKKYVPKKHVEDTTE